MSLLEDGLPDAGRLVDRGKFVRVVRIGLSVVLEVVLLLELRADRRQYSISLCDHRVVGDQN